MIPVHEEVYRDGVDQPLLFINSELGYQWQENITDIMKLVKPKDRKGILTKIIKIHIITIKIITFRNNKNSNYNTEV